MTTVVLHMVLKNPAGVGEALKANKLFYVPAYYLIARSRVALSH